MDTRPKPIDAAHMPKPKTTAAVKRTNDEQRMPYVEDEATRQRESERK